MMNKTLKVLHGFRNGTLSALVYKISNNIQLDF